MPGYAEVQPAASGDLALEVSLPEDGTLLQKMRQALCRRTLAFWNPLRGMTVHLLASLAPFVGRWASEVEVATEGDEWPRCASGSSSCVWKHWTLLLAALLYSGPSVSGDALRPPPRDLALLIGVEEYQNRQDLPETTPTIRRIKAALIAHDFEVDAETNADTSTFRKKLTAFLNTCEGRCVFYFTGHGVDAGKDGRGVSCLLLKDSISNANSCLHEDSAGAADAIEADGRQPFALDELASNLEGASAKNLLVVLDACYAGSLTAHFAKKWGSEPLAQVSGTLQTVLDKAASIEILTSGGVDRDGEGVNQNVTVPRGSRFGRALACSLVDSHVDIGSKDGTISFSDLSQRILEIMEGDDSSSPYPAATFNSLNGIKFEKIQRGKVTADLLSECSPS